jgi:hypothetical protein
MRDPLKMYEKRGVLHLKNFYAFILWWRQQFPVWAHFLRQSRKKPGFSGVPSGHPKWPDPRGIAAQFPLAPTIRVAWASSNFAKQNCDQPLARPRREAILRRKIAGQPLARKKGHGLKPAD